MRIDAPVGLDNSEDEPKKQNAEVLTGKQAKSEIVVKTVNSKTRSPMLRRLGPLVFLAGLALFLSACHHRAVVVTPPAPAPTPPAPSKRRKPSRPKGQPVPPAPIVQGEEGIASWYGHPFDGRQTSSGEIYNMHAMTAAHRTLPFGTMVQVHDLENGKSVVVRINDRGPFVEGRIIDLSYAAAMAMGMTGTALVRLQILKPGQEAASGLYSVQIGAFLDPANAERLKQSVEKKFQPVIIKKEDHGDRVFNLVLVGQENTLQQAQELADQLVHSKLAKQTYVVRIN
jgi:peptidoglycan lytic transglycosylase